MKIGILSYYGVHNYGALLQANALKTVLDSMGHECFFLTFSRNYDMTPVHKISKYRIGFGSVAFYLRYLMDKGPGNILFNLQKARIAKKYRTENIPLAERYCDFCGDAAIIGSDEVFSLEVGINPFFFGHGIRCPKVLSYAGCFGPTTIDEIDSMNYRDLISSGLMKMDAVSVRDQNSNEIVEKLARRSAEIVCDPVILYGYKDEMVSAKPKMDDYIVVYSYDRNMNDPQEAAAIRDFAKEKRCKIVSVGNYHKWCDKNIVADPVGMLTWIKNAKYVITDTFHGTVVAIICNTPMMVKIRGNSNKLEFLLKEYELTNRIVSDFHELSQAADKNIDFHAVNRIIDKKRQLSMNYLMEALGDKCYESV